MKKYWMLVITLVFVILAGMLTASYMKIQEYNSIAIFSVAFVMLFVAPAYIIYKIYKYELSRNR